MGLSGADLLKNTGSDLLNPRNKISYTSWTKEDQPMTKNIKVQANLSKRPSRLWSQTSSRKNFNQDLKANSHNLPLIPVNGLSL
jgi:hypothetical protein